MFWFRVLDGNRLTGHVGIVAGATTEALFGALDEFCDPHSVELREVVQGGFCVHMKKPRSDDDDPKVSDLECSDHLPRPWEEESIDSSGPEWFSPDWSCLRKSEVPWQ